MRWFSLKYVFNVVFLSLPLSLGYVSANPIQRQVPKVTEEIENFFKNEDLESYSDYIHELVKGCRVVHHNPDMVRICTRRSLNRDFKNMSERVANFIIKSCDKDDAPISSYGQVLTTCAKKLKQDIAEGLLPRETPIQPTISVNPEEKAANEAESFLRKDANSFIENRLDDLIKYCYYRDPRHALAQSCTYARLPHNEFILKKCRENNLLNRDLSTAKEFKAEVVACLNTLRNKLGQESLNTLQLKEDILSN